MNGCFTFALTVLTLRFCFYRAILCKFLVFLYDTLAQKIDSTSSARITVPLVFTSKILCVAVSKKFTGIRKYFADDERGKRCKRIFKISQKMARLIEKFLISNKFK